MAHFLIAALLIGAYFNFIAEPDDGDPRVIVISEENVSQIVSQWQSRWRRLPTEVELDNEIANLVQQELLFREGVSLGLDNDDSFVRNRVIQKTRYLVDASIEDPSDQQLEQWLESRVSEYQGEPAYSFEQILLRDQMSDGEIQALIRQMNQGSVDAGSVLKQISLDRKIFRASKSDVQRQFGERFVDDLLKLEAENTTSADQWAGVIRSGYGAHLVRGVTVEGPAKPSLQDAGLKRRLRNDWIADAKRRALESKLIELSGQYEIQIEK